jgi:hypothetical protein
MTDTTTADLATLTPDQLRQLAETQARRIVELEQHEQLMQTGWRIVSALLEHGCAGSSRISEAAVKESSGKVVWVRIPGGYVLATGVPE